MKNINISKRIKLILLLNLVVFALGTLANTYFAIIDEVDSILIDEARTPLIISGPGEQSSDLYKSLNKSKTNK